MRRYRKEDLDEIDRIWRRHHSHSFSLPSLAPSIIDCVVESNGIVAFGNLKIFAECIMVMDHERSRLELARAFREIMPVAIMGAQQSGISEIHAVCTDPSFADILRKHYGFTDVLGEHLKKEVD